MPSCRVVFIIGLLSVHCSGAVISEHPTGADAGPVKLPSGDSGGSVIPPSGDAGGQALCQDLESDAGARLEALIQQNLACTSDDDCTRISPEGRGQCAALCGDLLTNQAGASMLLAAANTLCASFVAEGCQVQLPSCVAVAPLNICAAGTCEGWGVSLSPTAGPFALGACAPFEISFYTAESMSAVAPHDIVFALAPENGTIYADSACTTPLMGGSLMLPGGANSVAFGFVPLAAGQSGFSGSGSDHATIGIDFLPQ
jgi:hypothetical protein